MNQLFHSIALNGPVVVDNVSKQFNGPVVCTLANTQLDSHLFVMRSFSHHSRQMQYNIKATTMLGDDFPVMHILCSNVQHFSVLNHVGINDESIISRASISVSQRRDCVPAVSKPDHYCHCYLRLEPLSHFYTRRTVITGGLCSPFVISTSESACMCE